MSSIFMWLWPFVSTHTTLILPLGCSKRMTIIIYESSCKHEQLNGKYEKKKSSTINKFGSTFNIKIKMKIWFLPSLPCNLLHQLNGSWFSKIFSFWREYMRFLKFGYYLLFIAWILFIVLLLWFKRKNDFFQ